MIRQERDFERQPVTAEEHQRAAAFLCNLDCVRDGTSITEKDIRMVLRRIRPAEDAE